MIKKERLLQLFDDISNVFKKLNITYWIDCGTLLGAVRNGKIIPWEIDIDLGIWKHSMPNDSIKTLVSELEGTGALVIIYPNHINVSKDNYHIDIKLYKIINEYAVEEKWKPKTFSSKIIHAIWMGTYDKKRLCPLSKIIHPHYIIRSISSIVFGIIPNSIKLKLRNKLFLYVKKFGAIDISEYVPKHYFDEITLINFEEREVSAPKDHIAYLEYRYGKTWRTPQEDWITEQQDGAVLNKKI